MTTTSSTPDPVLDLSSEYGVTTCALLQLVPLLRVAEEIEDHETAASIVSAMTLIAPPNDQGWAVEEAA